MLNKSIYKTLTLSPELSQQYKLYYKRIQIEQLKICNREKSYAIIGFLEDSKIAERRSSKGLNKLLSLVRCMRVYEPLLVSNISRRERFERTLTLDTRK